MNVDEVVTLRNNSAIVFGSLRTRFQTALELYNREWSILHPDVQRRYDEVIPLTAKTIVDVIASNLIPDDINFNVEPLRNTQKFTEHADKLEADAYLLSQRLNADYSPIPEAIKNTLIYGLGWLRTIYKPAPMPEDNEWERAKWEASKKSRFPFVVTAIDPQNILPAPDYKSWIMESFERFAYEVDAEFGTAHDDKLQKLKWIAYWSADEKLYIVNDSELVNKYTENPYGIIPYTPIWSGLGKHSPDGKMENEILGILFPLKGLLEEEARVITAVSIILQTTALRPILYRNAPEGFEWPIGPGQMQDVGEMEFIDFPMPTLSKDTYNLLTIVSQQIERAVGEQLFGGGRQVGVGSGLFEGMLLEQARKRYAPIIRSIEAGYSDLMGKMLCLIERHKIEIPGMKLKPSEIGGYYDVKAKFVNADIAEKRISSMIARMLYMSGIIDLETAWGPDYMNIPDSSKVRKGLMIDKILTSPEMTAALVTKAAEAMGVERLLEMAAERKQKRERIGLSQQEERQIAADIFGPIRSVAQRRETDEEESILT
jgi:hypothetical protein